ncbi:MAG: ROK family protein [Ruthenibacterium lactatiformans]
MVFLTFGTGLGAGLILTGGSTRARTVWRARRTSAARATARRATASAAAEGFCSGGGLRRLAQRCGSCVRKAGTRGSGPPRAAEAVTAKDICTAAQAGDGTAGHRGGKRGVSWHGLVHLIDLFNPERIVIGSIFARAEALFRPGMEAVIAREALAQSAAVCCVVPAQLGDSIGDVAALTIAIEFSQKNGKSVTDYGA